MPKERPRDRVLPDAELEASTSQKARIDVLTNAFNVARKQEDIASRSAAMGVATVLAPLETKAYRLQIEIKLAERRRISSSRPSRLRGSLFFDPLPRS